MHKARVKHGELTVTTIVILVLVLIAAVVLLAGLAQRAGFFQNGADKLVTDGTSLCAKAGGTCLDTAKACTGTVRTGSFIDCQPPSVCCT